MCSEHLELLLASDCELSDDSDSEPDFDRENLPRLRRDRLNFSLERDLFLFGFDLDLLLFLLFVELFVFLLLDLLLLRLLDLLLLRLLDLLLFLLLDLDFFLSLTFSFSFSLLILLQWLPNSSEAFFFFSGDCGLDLEPPSNLSCFHLRPEPAARPSLPSWWKE